MSTIRHVFLYLLLFWWASVSLYAQELTLSGVGPINHSLAGTAVALPRDSAGAMRWNPATIAFLEHSDYQLSWGRLNAPWYGDEPIGYTALIGVWFIAECVLQGLTRSNDDPFKDDQYWQENPSILTPPQFNEIPRPSPPVIRVPQFSFVYANARRWSFGLSVSEYGASKNGATTIGDAVGISQYRFQGYEFIPTVAYRESKRFSVGFSPIFSIDETPNASLPVIVSRYSGSPVIQDQRSRAGFGFQFGAYYQQNRRQRYGVSLRTPQLISRFTYRWTDPTTGEQEMRRLSFSQDSPFRIAVGTSYMLRNDLTTVAVDFRYDDYSHTAALYDIPASFDPAVKKLGVSRGVYSLALGAEHRFPSFLTLRMGYQWNHAVTPNKAVIYNTSLPVQSGHSIHYGTTFAFGEHFDLSFSISNAFGGGWETLQTEAGPVRFRRNPNRSNFWLGGRLLF